MLINQAALGATKLRDLSGLVGNERVKAVVGGEAGPAVELPLDGLNLRVVRGDALGITLVEPPHRPVSARGR